MDSKIPNKGDSSISKSSAGGILTLSHGSGSLNALEILGEWEYEQPLHEEAAPSAGSVDEPDGSLFPERVRVVIKSRNVGRSIDGETSDSAVYGTYFKALYARNPDEALAFVESLLGMGHAVAGMVAKCLAHALGRESSRDKQDRIIAAVLACGEPQAALSALVEDFKKHGGADRLDLAYRLALEFGRKALDAVTAVVAEDHPAAMFFAGYPLHCEDLSPAERKSIMKMMRCHPQAIVREEAIATYYDA